MSENDLMHFLKKFLSSRYSQVYSNPTHYVYAPGNNPVCLMAHVDTAPRRSLEIVQTRKIIFNRLGTLGADCRAGVFAIMKLIEMCRKDDVVLPSVLFTNHEETGGAGMRSLIQSRRFNPDICNLLISLDRRNANDYVYYSVSIPLETKKYVEGFGFQEAEGSFSDIMLLSNHYGIAGVNLSIGFYMEHTPMEYMKISDLTNSIGRVFQMLKRPIQSRQELSSEQLLRLDLDVTAHCKPLSLD